MSEHAQVGRLLELDPDLADELDPRNLLLARRRLVAPLLSVERGRWDPSTTPHGSGDSLGVLVVDGLLLREVALAESACAELLGPGDVIRPWQHIGASASLASEVEWRALSRSSVLLLDRRLATAMGPWPEVTTALLARAVARAQTLAVALAISCIRGLEVRLLALLWHLADTYGRVGRDGVIVPVPLTHHVIARLAGATRPSVSTALKELENEGRISKRLGGGFVLHGEPPDVVRELTDRRHSLDEEV